MRKPEGKRGLGRPRPRWKDNNKKPFQEVDCEGMAWINVAPDRDRWWAVVNAVIISGFHEMRGIS